MAAEVDGTNGHRASIGGDEPINMLHVGPAAAGGIKLKKGTMWGTGPESGKKLSSSPVLGVVGVGANGSTSPASSPRPPSTPTRPVGAERVGSFPAKRGPLSSLSGHSTPSPSGVDSAAAIVSRRLSPSVSPTNLPLRSLSSSSVISRGAASAIGADGPKVILQSGGGGGTDAELLAFPPTELPDGVAHGGGAEIEFLRAQLDAARTVHARLHGDLQRAQQESYAIRSSLLAQQQNGGGDDGSSSGGGGGGGSVSFAPIEPHAARDEPPTPSPLGSRALRRNSTISMRAAFGGQEQGMPPRPPKDNAKRKQRKRAPHQLREDVDDDADDDEIVHVHAKPEALTRRMLATLSKKAPFDDHEEAELSQLVAAMAPVEIEAGVDVLREGDSGDLAYWVDTGELSVLVGGDIVDTIRPDTVFGEVALLYDMPRTATIRAKTVCTMWLLHRATFRHIMRDSAIADRKARFAFLRTVKIFDSLSGRQISRIADVAETIVFESETEIIREADQADSMYIIEEGQAVVSQQRDDDAGAPGAGGEDGEGPSPAKSLLRILKAGDYFGERALLADELRSATVTAASRVKCLRIDKHSFVHLLGNLHAELLKRAPKDARPAAPQGASPHAARPKDGGEGGLHRMGSLNSMTNEDSSSASDSTAPGKSKHASHDSAGASIADSPQPSRPPAPPPAPRRGVAAKINPQELRLLKHLGSGGYGRVSLVRDTKSRRAFALKRVCRAHLLAQNGMMRCEWLAREKRVLETLDHPFIVHLHTTYATEEGVYLLLGVAMGGDLYRLIEKLGQVPEKIARFYAGSLTLALAHIHSEEIVYRDLKPENVLLDTQGYVKLCDFGFSKRVTDRTYTRCGTPDYTAPEMLLNQGVNQACDWWALGILIFEMLNGVPPFTDPGGDDMKTYQNITHGSLSSCYPEDSKASDEVRALIAGLCTVKVAYRLGYLKGGADDVMAHAWYAGANFDYDGLINLTLPSPWRPTLGSCDDTTCFDEDVGGESLEGPAEARAHPDELCKRWEALQAEYMGGGSLHDFSHLC